MQVKVYRAKPDTIDSWTIYFPYGKKYLRNHPELTGIKGTFLACSPGVNEASLQYNRDGFTRCYWGGP